eukprot:6367260-Pyramimonas_sp.AAC.1
MACVEMPVAVVLLGAVAFEGAPIPLVHIRAGLALATSRAGPRIAPAPPLPAGQCGSRAQGQTCISPPAGQRGRWK